MKGGSRHLSCTGELFYSGIVRIAISEPLGGGPRPEHVLALNQRFQAELHAANSLSDANVLIAQIIGNRRPD